MRKISIIFVLVVLSLGLWNYFTLQKNVSDLIKSDDRNEGISVIVHFEWFVNPSVIVFDIRDVESNKSLMDVSRVLLQLSEKLKDSDYQKVILSFKGRSKFLLEGAFFKETGMEYGIQNPVYTLRSLPQNVYNLDGTKAFPTWTGGLIGVLGKQMEDLTAFHEQWYIFELASGR
ncbi:hypothetical protein [Shewanella sp. ALD9]|uniref:hypothetical protein n=1 Tax=Shewanella sp. ALD9 TaxID=2058330 RepID=UPI000C344C8D|nr:hypothetical protein [Shewanella sp. ALD9]PKH31443.1 hypothetical protein CXF88_12900 [Shewanella sp. ALD9]